MPASYWKARTLLNNCLAGIHKTALGDQTALTLLVMSMYHSSPSVCGTWLQSLIMLSLYTFPWVFKN